MVTKSYPKLTLTYLQNVQIYLDPQNRFRIRHEANRTGNKYVVVFTKRWALKQDPSNTNPELRSKKTFKTKTEARKYGTEKADLADRLSGGFDKLRLSQQQQIIGLASELAERDTEPIELLQEALRISKLNLDPIRSLRHGGNVISLAEDHSDKTIGFFMDQFYDDPEINKLETASGIISNIKNNFHGLREVPISVLLDAELAQEHIQPILQEYCNRKNVKRKSSLNHQVRRLRQLLIFIQKKVKIPRESELNEITNLKKYNLEHNLISSKEDYALTAAEILVMIKWFFREKSFCPYYPILAGLMGVRFSLFTELKWQHFGGRGRKTNSTITIPRGIIKTVKLQQTNKRISFKTSAIPNLECWLWYALYREKLSGFKKHHNFKKDLVRTLSIPHISDARQECIKEWRHFFECEPESNDDYTWQNVAENGFRNAFITMGVRHDVVKKNVSHIADDRKSHDHYIDRNKPEADLEARVLFEMTPMYLELVDLENKTVDTDFLYANLSEKEDMWRKEPDAYKKEAYLRILESHNIFPDPFSTYVLKDDLPLAVNEFKKHLQDMNDDIEFWNNTTQDKLLYLTYYPSNSTTLKSWVDAEREETL
jgi:hypothetical protein